MRFTELARVRTHRSQDKGGYRWYNDYRLPSGGTVTVRLHGNAEDKKRKLNRPENVRPIPPTDPDFTTFESRYEEEMRKAREDASKMIRGNRSRAIFETEAQSDTLRGKAVAGALARQRGAGRLRLFVHL